MTDDAPQSAPAGAVGAASEAAHVPPAIAPPPAVPVPPPPAGLPPADAPPTDASLGGDAPTTASGLPNPHGLPEVAVERPELAVGAAFGGGLLLALILKRLAR